MSDKLRMKRFVPRYVKSGRRSRTDDYDQVAERRGMVVRRGEYFFLDVEFDAPLDDYDLFFFEVATTDFGKEELARRWILKEEPLRFSHDNSDDCPLQIRSTIHYTGSRKLTVVFYSASNAPVNKYRVTKMFTERNPGLKFSYDVKFAVTLIFNPFNPTDAVYMEDDKQREEYVMEDRGIVYYGSSRKIGGKPWYFAQFDDPVLDCAILLLAKSDLSVDQWGDPVAVARTLSALVNCNDDAGVLVGNWSGDYSDGRAPTEWKGSLRIITEYYKTQNPVCYGQCWVFSGLVTSFCRALGIPSRSITNFDSAHDTNCNLTVDQFFDEDFSPLEGVSNDSIWNFHVWNDVWMRRRDLSDDGQYDGWQAMDATPQEQSEGIYRTGPCPLKAIKEGRIEVDFDGPFLFAEVNACIKHFVKGSDGSNKEVFSDPRKVGQFISTKAVGSNERADITDEYKYKEGSREEDGAFRNAKNSKKVTVGDRSDDHKKRRNIQLAINSQEYCVIGDDIEVALEIASSARMEKKVQFAVTASLKKYNGKIIKKLTQEKGQIAVKANAAESIQLSIPAKSYVSEAGSEQVGIEIVAMAVEGNDKVVQQSIINLFTPEMDIEISGEVAQNKVFHFMCYFQNNFDFALQDARFTIEGPGMRGGVLEEKIGDVKPGAKAKCRMTLTPLRSGERSFVASFNSKLLKGVSMAYPVYVEPNPDYVIEDEIIPETV